MTHLCGWGCRDFYKAVFSSSTKHQVNQKNVLLVMSSARSAASLPKTRIQAAVIYSGQKLLPLLLCNQDMHLFVVVHGMWGSGSDVSYIAEQLRAFHGPSHVFVSSVNGGTNSYDGIDVCGERLYDEVVAFVASQTETQMRVNRISFVGYSAGGLYSRYCVGLMQINGFFDQITPVSFVTLACPHLGVRRGAANTMSRLFNSIAAWAVYRSGAQLTLSDTHGPASECLLLAMSRPKSVFVAGLQRFTRLVAFANVNSDRTVPFHTASLRRRNVYCLGADGFDLRTRLREFPHVVASPDSLKLMQLQNDALEPKKADIDSDGQVALQELENGGSWLEAGARIGIVTLLLPLWLVVAPTVTAVILRRKNAANVGQLQYRVPAADTEAADCDASAVAVSVVEAPSTQGSSDAQQLPAAAARDIKSEILQGIGLLPWLRVDVSLPGSHTHGRIVVRRPWIDSSGQDVVKFLVEVVLLR